MVVKDVFQYYNDCVKPLYCEIEARNNKLPVELLFEIHAAFDHLKRHHVDEEDENASCERAQSHLKRGMLDAFKLKLKYFNEDVVRFEKCKVDFSLLDNGAFYPTFVADRHNIMALAKKARLQEASSDRELAVEYWAQTSVAIDEFSDKFLTRHDHLSWAKRKTFTFVSKETLRGVLVGLIAASIFWNIRPYIFPGKGTKPSSMLTTIGQAAEKQPPSVKH